MKYRRLTREQLEGFESEFINFLATQKITGPEWERMKSERPELVEEELDLFSDLIWEGILGKVEYLENISKAHMHLFHLTEREMRLISVRVRNPDIDLTSKEGFAWFKRNYLSDYVEYLSATKAYGGEPNRDRFELIEKGAVITKGELYRWFEDMMAEKN